MSATPTIDEIRAQREMWMLRSPRPIEPESMAIVLGRVTWTRLIKEVMPDEFGLLVATDRTKFMGMEVIEDAQSAGRITVVQTEPAR